MTAAMLDSGKEFGRYLDVDGDGIPVRTYPGTHPSKGGYFTRGTSKNAFPIPSLRRTAGKRIGLRIQPRQ